MVRQIGIYILLMSIAYISHSQVPNGSFEAWDTTDQGKLTPKTWSSILPDSIARVSDAYDSNSAVRIATIPSFIDVAHPHTLKNEFHLGINNPARFRGYVKTRIPFEDTVYIKVTLYNNGEQTFQGVWTTTETIDTFHEVSIDIEDVNNDSASIRLKAGCCGELAGTSERTKLIVDALTFDSQVGKAVDNKQNSLKVYPNPAYQNVKVKGLSNRANYHYRILNHLGQVVKSGTLKGHEEQIPLNGLPEGSYQLRLLNETDGLTKSATIIKSQ